VTILDDEVAPDQHAEVSQSGAAVHIALGKPSMLLRLIA
jgi:hypothetical protein